MQATYIYCHDDDDDGREVEKLPTIYLYRTNRKELLGDRKQTKREERKNILFSPISSLNRFIMPLFIHNTTYNKGENVEATMTITRNHQAGTMYFSNENLFECGSLTYSLFKFRYNKNILRWQANKPWRVSERAGRGSSTIKFIYYFYALRKGVFQAGEREN
jgi:hypothetical protein